MDGPKENIYRNLLILILLTLLQWYVGNTTAFLLTGTCPVRQPCQCDGETLDCYGLSLKIIPHFYQTALQSPFIRISLGLNSLRTIPADAFQNLASIKGSYIKLELENNRILFIDDNAFNGIENTTRSLDLRSNYLQTLPKAIAKLRSLQKLNILGNRLNSLDTTVLSRISGSLKNFEFSGYGLDRFPTEINLLTSLDNLMIERIYVQINDDAFDGLTQTLKTLEFDEVWFPAALCKLQALERLVIFSQPKDEMSLNEKNVTLYDAAEPTNISKRFFNCNNTMSSVTHLTINVVDFFLEDIFTTFPSLLYLSINDNYKAFSNNKYIPTNAVLEIFYLESNHFPIIPRALNMLDNLKELYLAHNFITTIGSHDIAGLTRLQILDLTNNPLKYIATDSFARNVNLRVLILDETDIAAIPAAVASLPSLSTLHLNDLFVLHCDCASLSNVTSWSVDAITFVGFCDKSANSTIKAFIKDEAPKCP